MLCRVRDCLIYHSPFPLTILLRKYFLSILLDPPTTSSSRLLLDTIVQPPSPNYILLECDPDLSLLLGGHGVKCCLDGCYG
jgi:hypothetical protein